MYLLLCSCTRLERWYRSSNYDAEDDNNAQVYASSTFNVQYFKFAKGIALKFSPFIIFLSRLEAEAKL